MSDRGTTPADQRRGAVISLVAAGLFLAAFLVGLTSAEVQWFTWLFLVAAVLFAITGIIQLTARRR